MNFEDIKTSDLLLPSVEVIQAINKKAEELRVAKIDRSCIDCIRKKYFEIRVEIDPPTIVYDENGDSYIADFKIAGDCGWGMIARNSSEVILQRYYNQNPNRFKRYEIISEPRNDTSEVTEHSGSNTDRTIRSRKRKRPADNGY